MATLPQLALDLNHQVKLSTNGGSLSSDTGEFILGDSMKKLFFQKR